MKTSTIQSRTMFELMMGLFRTGPRSTQHRPRSFEHRPPSRMPFGSVAVLGVPLSSR
jgi:hypothetical protein